MLSAAPYPQLAILYTTYVIPRWMALFPFYRSLASRQRHQDTVSNLHFGKRIFSRPTATASDREGDMFVNVHSLSLQYATIQIGNMSANSRGIVHSTRDRTELHRTAQKRSLRPDNNGHTPIRGVRCPVSGALWDVWGQKKHAPDRQEGNQPGATAGSWVALGKERAPVALVAYDKESQAAQFDMRQ